MRRTIGVFLFCAAALLCSCNSSTKSSSSSETSSQPPQQYKLHGEIVTLEPDGDVAKIRHQEIKGWMGAMTMEYPVKDAAEFKTLHQGDCIDATVYVQDLRFWIGEIQPAQADKGACVAPPAPAPAP